MSAPEQPAADAAAQSHGRPHASTWYVKLDSEESKVAAWAAIAVPSPEDLAS